jgi:NADH:ubiquinone oxidoreductase subunit F (NADH-binding)
MYSLFGCIEKPGIFEAPRGLTLGQLINTYGGGISSDVEFSFAVVGGAAGTFVSRNHWDHELGFSHTDDVIPLGTGGVLVCDTTQSVPETLREILHFFERESCGKCTPCRIGTREARQLLDRLIAGSGQSTDLDRLKQLSSTLKLSLCGLGTSVPSPLRSALNISVSNLNSY